MARVLILGGGGMVGQKLARRLDRDGLPGAGRPELHLQDIAPPDVSGPRAQARTGDLTDPSEIARIAAERYDMIFHLASVVSGEAEADFDKGWQTNLWPTWTLLEALRAQHAASGGAYRPKLIFTSSIAVFGGPYPEKLDDAFHASPQTSYGAHKAACELLIQDFTRKGFIEGMSLRLPTICVRPGKPNTAASSFFSGIIREPLNGEEAILPVADTVRHTHASPRSAAGFLRHAAGLSRDAIGAKTAINLPGISCSVAEQIEALRDVAGSEAVARIRSQPDETIAKIVSGWPETFDPARALALGFHAEESFKEIIEVYIADDLPRDPGRA
ncbi:MAG: D-erythronate dehydrogenase [Pseudomonadota bacterium]